MNSRTVGLRVAGVVFSLVCLAQIARLVTRVQIIVAGWAMPLWPNAVAAVVAGALGLWMLRLATKGDT